MSMLLNRDEILEAVDAATSPRSLGREQAVAWLEQLICDLEVRVDALKEELQ